MHNANTIDFDPFLVFEKMNMGFLLLQAKDDNYDPLEYTIVCVNPYFCQLFDRDKKHYIGKEASQLLTINETFYQVTSHVIATGEPNTYEVYVDTLDRWLSLAIYRPKKSLVAIICDDLTESKRLEEQLAESEETMRVTLDVADEGIWQWHAEDNQIRHNKKWSSIMGIEDTGSHVFHDFVQFVHPEDQDKIRKSWEEVFVKHQAYSIEYRVILSDGKTIWLEDRGIPIISNGGKVERVIGSMTDITRYRESQQQLYLEKEVLQATLLSVGDVLIATDVDGRVYMMNPAAEHETGWTLKDIEGKSIYEIFQFIDPVTNELFTESLEELALSREKAGENIQAQIVMLRSGKKLSIYYHVTPIRRPDDTKAGYIIVISDISSLIERQKRIAYLSYHDELTGLYNRRYLMDAMHRLDSKRNHPFAIMIIDVNNLKAINDKYGHPVGDRYIKMTADYLKGIFRNEDIIARTGGDEFCILLPKTEQKTAEAILERIKNELEPHDPSPERLSISIGFAIKTDEDIDIDEVYRKADENMYKDKRLYHDLSSLPTISDLPK